MCGLVIELKMGRECLEDPSAELPIIVKATRTGVTHFSAGSPRR